MTLRGSGLRKEYPARGRAGGSTVAVQDASFVLEAGRTIGVVGESGSGKSTLGRLALGIEEPTAGHLYLDGVDVSGLQKGTVRAFKKAVQPIFQDPRSALNWRHSVDTIVNEPLVNDGLDRAARAVRVRELLDQVQLPETVIRRKPRELSGGMLQRVAIARALALQPRYLICDEVLSALDMSVQAGVVNLLLQLQRDQDLAMLFISHDLDVVRHMSDDVIVMCRGEVVESGPADEVYRNPQDEYTRYLLGRDTAFEEKEFIHESA
jgi:peptide/nickel transport system ATP-binding protein